MKKLVAYLLVFAMMVLTACSSKEEVKPDPEPETPVAEEINEEEPNEFCALMDTDERPIAVMIDNDEKRSRPQIGVESAYAVYELMIEGGKTRMMALFKEHNLEKVGPVRSSRHYFLDYALEHDAIYCHAGWSPQAQADIPALGVNNINGILGDDGTAYWRDSTYDNTWHNLYTGLDKLYDKAENAKGYRMTSAERHMSYSNDDITPEDEDITEINIPYSSAYRVSYSYDADNGVYTRFVDGSEHMSQTGNALTAKNIIIYQIAYSSIDDKGRQDISNIGSGDGYYITNGKCVNIKWSKASRTDKTKYTTEDGSELILNPGNTFIQIVPTSGSVTLS